MRFDCATTNPGKMREFQRAAEHFGVTGVELEFLPRLREIEPPEETGATFEENAVGKAVYYSRFTDEHVLADDSGLAVDELGGAPGVYSARYAGEHAGDKANNALLVANMRGKKKRSCRFICVIGLARGGELVRTFTGIIEGELLEEERGDGGFGYDPLFYYPPFDCTLAEVDEARKMDVSHRGKALAGLFDYLRSLRV
jgi:XTP/dITP diphosphohydrolase